jgi:hypothetical protein
MPRHSGTRTNKAPRTWKELEKARMERVIKLRRLGLIGTKGV